MLTRLVPSNQFTSKSAEPFILGGLTGVITSFFLCPFDGIKCRSQVSRAVGASREGSFSTIVRHLWRSKGPAGFFNGIVAQVSVTVPFYFFFFGTYSLSCEQLKKRTSLSESLCFFISGGGPHVVLNVYELNVKRDARRRLGRASIVDRYLSARRSED
jgi:hypothetical protein